MAGCFGFGAAFAAVFFDFEAGFGGFAFGSKVGFTVVLRDRVAGAKVGGSSEVDAVFEAAWESTRPSEVLARAVREVEGLAAASRVQEVAS